MKRFPQCTTEGYVTFDVQPTLQDDSQGLNRLFMRPALYAAMFLAPVSMLELCPESLFNLNVPEFVSTSRPELRDS